MPRIPDSEIERLKTAVPLSQLLAAEGHVLKRQGRDLAMRCPLHEGDDTPSFIVTPSKNVWHCFGCQQGGTTIDWLMARHGLSFRDAVARLQRELPSAGAAPTPPPAAAASAPPQLHPAADAPLLAQVIAAYHANLQASAPAQDYLAKRGLLHPDLIDTFRLGYANRTLCTWLPKEPEAALALRARLQAIGLLRGSGHEHFAGSLVVPVFDTAGDVVEVYGRKITRELRRGTPRHLYLPGPHRGMFNAAGLVDAAEVILCEALIDALTFWCAGFTHVTSAFGVSGVTDELIEALVTQRVRRVLIAFDADAAGDTGAESLAPRLAARGIAAYRVRFPDGLDANAYALQHATPETGVQAAQAALARLLEQAAPMAEADVADAHVHAPAEAALTATDATACTHAAAPDAIPSSVDGVVARDAATSAPVTAASPDAVTDTAADADNADAHEAVSLDVRDQEAFATIGAHRYRVRGLERALSAEVLRVNLLVSAGPRVHVDTLDLYQARARAAFAKAAAIELGSEESVIAGDLTRLLLALEAAQAERITAALAPATPEPLPPVQQAAALALLRDPALIERIVADVAATGVVGEAANALVGYLACVSRKLDKPLAVLIQSTSAAGKSTLMDALLSLMPEAERVHYSAMTGQSLFYLGEGDLEHRILAIAEEEGVRQASYALKLLQSQGELTIASTGKDPATGKLMTTEYRVRGPVMLFLTTTAIDIDEELLNRCVVLTVDESREQTAAIHRQQRQARTLEGLLAQQQAAAVRDLHRAAQTLLRPLSVVNPYAERLTFRSECTRLRRDHAKYLTLIDAIALLHQQQRPIRTLVHGETTLEYVEVTKDDIALANRLAHEVLGRSLDELPPQTRRVLGLLDAYVRGRMQAERSARSAVRFTRRQAREATALRDTQLRVHLERLVQLEYVLAHRGTRGQSFVYELLFDGAADGAIDGDDRRLIGLIDAEALAGRSSRGAAAGSRGMQTKVAGPSRPDRGAVAVATRSMDAPASPHSQAQFPLSVAAVGETHVAGARVNGRSRTPA